MNLEESNEYFQFQQNKNKKKKIILFFIIFLIFLILFLVISIVILKKKDASSNKLFLNGNKINWSTSLFLEQDGQTYVSAKIMSNFIGGEYIKGEYKAFTQDKDKCYIQTPYEIISIKADSKYVKKYLQNKNFSETSESSNNNLNSQNVNNYIVNSENDTMELFELESNVIYLNDTVYVPIENIEEVFNIDYSVKENSVYIYTLDYLFNYARSFVGSKNIPIISNTYENIKALLDDKVVVANKNKKYGVIDLKTGEIVISYQYSKIIYKQNSKEFFIYTDNSVGLLGSDTTTLIIEPTKYDSISIFDELNKLYLAEKSGKFGILDVEGNEIIPINFDVIGTKAIANYEKFEIPESETPNLIQSKVISVSKDGKIGLYNIKGERLLNVNYESLGYIATSDDEVNEIKSTLVIPKKIGVEGLIVKNNNLYGIYDLNLEDFVIPISLEKIYSKLDNNELNYFMLSGDEEIEISTYIKENGLDYIERIDEESELPNEGDIEENPDEGNIEENPDEGNIEENPDEGNMEENPDEGNMEENPDEGNMEENPDEGNMEDNPDEGNIDENFDEVAVSEEDFQEDTGEQFDE